jgi:arginine/serine-rich splicing factor 7
MSRRKIYVTGYSSRDDEKDIKKLFKKYGKIDEVSWKGRFCFIVIFNFFLIYFYL